MRTELHGRQRLFDSVARHLHMKFTRIGYDLTRGCGVLPAVRNLTGSPVHGGTLLRRMEKERPEAGR